MKTLKALSPLFAVLFFGSTLSAQTHVVTTSDDYVTGSLRHWVTNSSANDTIVFDPSILANGSDTIKVDFPIIFNHGLTIKGLFLGGDTLYISGQDTSRIFYMDFDGVSGVEMYLEDLAIIEGQQHVVDYLQRVDNGGAIMGNGLESLKINNCVFRDNHTSGEGDGGAIFAMFCSEIVISNCIAQGNTTELNVFANYSRGGFLKVNETGSLIITSSTLSNNVSLGAGGAITTFKTPLLLSNSSFNKNSAGYAGGALALFSNSIDNDTVALITNVLFENNLALSGEGGAIISRITNADSNFIKIQDSYFYNNKSYLAGGACEIQGVEIQLNNNTFVSNRSDDDGGAIYFKDAEALVQRNTFVNNFADDGNTILFLRGSTDIVNSTILGGDSVVSGSQVLSFAWQAGGSVSIEGSILSQNGNLPTYETASLWSSNGHNIFSDNPTFSVGSDQVSVNSTALDLFPLDNYGGLTPTMPPMSTSPAYNAGNAMDMSMAQNGPIYGIREIGAAESRVISADTSVVCGPITWWGNTYTQAGTYTDTAYNANGTLDSTGVLVLTEINDSATIKNPYIVALEQSVGTTYQWIDCNNPLVTLTGATDSIYQPTTNGSYAVIISLDGCVDTSNCVVYNQVSLDENVLPEQWMTFYPNPTNGSITVRGLDKNSLPTSLAIMDLSGRPLHEMTITSERIQLPPLAEGMYLLKFRGEDGLVQVERVVVRE
ncbi:MAG: hypothetical protein SchgKO_07540 [Schleiferiaceae bacterium]